MRSGGIFSNALGDAGPALNAPAAVDYPSFYAQLAYFDTGGDSAPVVACAKQAQAKGIPFGLKPGSPLNAFLDACATAAPPAPDAAHFAGSYLGCFISPVTTCPLSKKLVVAGGIVAIVGLGIYLVARHS